MLTWCSMHDKTLAPDGQNSIIVQVPAPYHWMNGWGTGSGPHGPHRGLPEAEGEGAG